MTRPGIEPQFSRIIGEHSTHLDNDRNKNRLKFGLSTSCYFLGKQLLLFKSAIFWNDFRSLYSSKVENSEIYIYI